MYKFIFVFIVIISLNACNQKKAGKNIRQEYLYSQELLIKVVDSLLDENEILKARHFFVLIDTADSMNGDICMLRGRMLIREDRPEEARINFNKAISMNYRQGDAYFNIAFTFVYEQRYDLAIKYLDSCILINHNDSVAIRGKEKLLKMLIQNGKNS